MKDFYQITAQNVTIYKDDELVLEGKCYGFFENRWDEDIEDYEREEDGAFIVFNDKILYVLNFFYILTLIN